MEDETSRVLFDTGPDGSFLHNAQRMGVSLSDLTATVLSHGHYDHCGGVPWLPDNSRIICHPLIAQQRYSALSLAGRRWKVKNCREKLTTPATAWSTAANRWRSANDCCGPARLRSRVREPMASSRVNRRGRLPCRRRRADLPLDAGLVIICGCGHRGLIDTIRHCQKITGVQQIRAIIGGLHLRSAPPWVIRRLKQFLRQQKVEEVMACHCTGSWGRWWLAADSAPATGDTLVLE